MRAGWAHQLARPTASLCHRSRTATPIVGGRPALALRSRPGRVLFALGPCSQDWVVPRWTRTMQSKGSAGIEWIREAPKIELHVHLDGAFSTDILWNLAKCVPLWYPRCCIGQESAQTAVPRNDTPPATHVPLEMHLVRMLDSAMSSASECAVGVCPDPAPRTPAGRRAGPPACRRRSRRLGAARRSA
jgi:hypothetical protein